MTEDAGCAAYLGGPVDTLGRINKSGIKCISTTNRNFPGRMGDKESQVFPRQSRNRGGQRHHGEDDGSARVFELMLSQVSLGLLEPTDFAPRSNRKR